MAHKDLAFGAVRVDSLFYMYWKNEQSYKCCFGKTNNRTSAVFGKTNNRTSAVLERRTIVQVLFMQSNFKAPM